jgi:hypothetical protein
MSIEQRLREAYDRAASSEPGEGTAYDRFLRRRARHDRAVAVATSIVLVVVLAAAVLVPRVVASRQQAADQPRPLPSSLVTKPDQGFELRIPDGWRVRELDGPLGLLLVPARPSTAALPAMIMVRTDVLDPLSYPGPRPPLPPDYPALRPHRVVGAPYVEGRRADGRWFVRSDHANQLPGAWQQRYLLAWPYRCANGARARCPWEARYRGLLVEAASPPSERAATQAALRRVVENVRPIGNAVDGPEPPATRRPCRIPSQGGHSTDLELQTPDSKPRDASEVGLEVEFRSSAALVSCRLRQRVTLELWEGGRLADVRGNRSTMEFHAILPEDAAGSRWIAAAWRWQNWCGSPNVTVRYVGLPGWEHPPLRPRCLDPAKPSTLQRATWPR